MTPCSCGHFHVLKCRRCGCKAFVAERATDWYPTRDSYQPVALRGDVSL
jgi:hypothetical protein